MFFLSRVLKSPGSSNSGGALLDGTPRDNSLEGVLRRLLEKPEMPSRIVDGFHVPSFRAPLGGLYGYGYMAGAAGSSGAYGFRAFGPVARFFQGDR